MEKRLRVRYYSTYGNKTIDKTITTKKRFSLLGCDYMLFVLKFSRLLHGSFTEMISADDLHFQEYPVITIPLENKFNEFNEREHRFLQFSFNKNYL